MKRTLALLLTALTCLTVAACVPHEQTDDPTAIRTEESTAAPTGQSTANDPIGVPDYMPLYFDSEGQLIDFIRSLRDESAEGTLTVDSAYMGIQTYNRAEDVFDLASVERVYAPQTELAEKLLYIRASGDYIAFCYGNETETANFVWLRRLSPDAALNELEGRGVEVRTLNGHGIAYAVMEADNACTVQWVRGGRVYQLNLKSTKPDEELLGLCRYRTVFTADTLAMIEGIDLERYHEYWDMLLAKAAGEPDDEGKPLEGIAVYSEDEIAGSLKYIGVDTTLYSTLSSLPTSSADMLMHYPGGAVRKLQDGRAYIVYDLDSGCRLFRFLYGKYDYICSEGFPLVIKEPVCYDDFAALKTGDSIEKVCEVDPVGEFYKKRIEASSIDKVMMDGMIEEGRGFSSIHYLTDGILLIAYDMDENRDLFIRSMTYSKDYTLPNNLGGTTDYRVCEVDLP